MRNTDYATAEDFKRWEEKAHGMTTSALEWSMNDAWDASRAMEDHNPVLAGRYGDEAMTYQRVLLARKADIKRMVAQIKG